MVSFAFTLGSCRMFERAGDPHYEFLSIQSKGEANIVAVCKSYEEVFLGEMHMVLIFLFFFPMYWSFWIFINSLYVKLYS